MHGAAARFAGSRRAAPPVDRDVCHPPTVSDPPGKIAETADIDQSTTFSGQYRTFGRVFREVGIAPSGAGHLSL